MKMKRLLVLAVLLVLLSLAALLQEGGKGPEEGPREVFAALDVESVNKITVKQRDKETALVKKEGRWLVADAGNYPAGRDYVEPLLEALARVETRRVATRQKEKHAQFEVGAAKGIEVELWGAQEEPLAHFYVGKQGVDFMSSYLRRASEEAVLEASENLTYLFRRGDWRERSVFTPKVEDVRAISLGYPDGEVVLTREKEGEWRVRSPSGGPADKEKVTELFTALTSLKVVRFLEEAPEGEESGLDTPRLKVDWQVWEGPGSGFVCGKADKGLCYAGLAGIDGAVMLPEVRLKPLLEKVDFAPADEGERAPGEKGAVGGTDKRTGPGEPE